MLLIPLFLTLILSQTALCQPSTIYEILKENALPMGILPNGVKNFTVDSEGVFEVYLDQACNAMFENEIHYDVKVSGNLSYGKIGQLDGIAAQDLFLWFPVKEIRVDLPSSGLIYFDVGVVSKQFSLSSFDIPKECTAVQATDTDVRITQNFLLLDS